ncbi:MAG: hypothetical protein Q8T13_13710 [Acidobacteriota bacterium]|nr:hypothetical protein [Acidobacteriota bacterium]
MNVTALSTAKPPAADYSADLSKLATDALDSILQRQIATLLFKCDSRNMRAIIEDLDPVSQQKYLNAAATSMRQVDERWHIPGLYAAVDAGDRFEGGTGITTMHKDVRLHELGRVDAAIRRYRQFLAGQAGPDMETKAQACAVRDRGAV